MAQRMQACAACHGKEGRASSAGYLPRIAGKPPGYLHNQLRHFQEGRRRNAAMAYLVEHLSDAYLREISAYFGTLELPYPPPAPSAARPDELARGRTLALHGDRALGLPACVKCHGDALMGVMPNFPGLLGLPRDYLLAQLGAWQAGQRRASPPDCMHTVAQRLTPRDVGAVASWLAAQPVPTGARPAPGRPANLPLPCGGGGP